MELLAFIPLIIWSLLFAYNIVIINNKGIDSVNVKVSPSGFTTCGVLGTFIGIIFGLWNFNTGSTQEISSSIPQLLTGLKSAFFTSIVGIIFYFIANYISKKIYVNAEKRNPAKSNNEINLLQTISSTLEDIKGGIGGMQNFLVEIQSSLGGDSNTSLLTQIQKLRNEQTDYSKEAQSGIDSIIKTLNNNSKLMQNKFDEFVALLAQNNTDALVAVMENATKEFNKQMSALIDRLVKENFEELNNSVNRLNDWQQENKIMIEKLTEQFKGVSQDFKISSESIKEITSNTEKLTDENSQLIQLIKTLKEVMVDDKKFQDIVLKITNTVDVLENNTKTFDATTQKLNEWVRDHQNIRESVDILINRLKEIEKIKDINGEFWSNTKKQLNEGVGILSDASKKINESLEDISSEFQQQLKLTLTSLDVLIQRLMEKNQAN